MTQTPSLRGGPYLGGTEVLGMRERSAAGAQRATRVRASAGG
jgi:hypothetical protein